MISVWSNKDISVGNLSKYLPIVLNEIKSQPKRQYLLLHSLREVFFIFINISLWFILTYFLRLSWERLPQEPVLPSCNPTSNLSSPFSSRTVRVRKRVLAMSWLSVSVSSPSFAPNNSFPSSRFVFHYTFLYFLFLIILIVGKSELSISACKIHCDHCLEVHHPRPPSTHRLSPPHCHACFPFSPQGLRIGIHFFIIFLFFCLLVFNVCFRTWEEWLCWPSTMLPTTSQHSSETSSQSTCPHSTQSLKSRYIHSFILFICLILCINYYYSPN